MDPEVLVFDEPTSALDPATAEEVVDLLDELNHEGRTVLLSTHDVELAYRWAGEVLRHGSPKTIFSDTALLHRARLKPPTVMDLFRELSDRGLFKDETPPRSALAFTNRVEGLTGDRRPHDGCGTIYIWDTAAADSTALDTFLSSGAVRPGGGGWAPGQNGGRRRRGSSLTFTYGVIDRCLLRMVAGEDSLILTTGGMLAHTCGRVDAYARESGREIGIRVLGRDVHIQSMNGRKQEERHSNTEIASDCRQ